MKVILKTVFMGAVIGAAFAFARSAPAGSSRYSKGEIKQMERDAHRAQQYQDLSAYFSDRQKWFEAQAQSEKQERDRRSQNTSGLATKYPRPVDSSKNRYEYFSYEASEMNQQAAKYQALADKSR